ncbi:sensor histidine kinase [Lachnospiraceae bacterium C1.1]|nr:sensor histidine kinase [Lachnospiraceae bacterium C1.1]
MGNLLKTILLKKVREQSFRKMIYKIFIFSTILEFVILNFFWIINHNTQYDRLVRQKQEILLNSGAKQLEEYISTLIDITDNVYFNILKDDFTSEEEKQLLFNYAYNSNSRYIKDIACFNMSGEAVMTAPQIKIKENVNVCDEEWFRAAVGNPENIAFSEPVVDDLYDFPTADYEWVIPVSRYLEISTGREKFEGVIVVNFNYSELTRMCKTLSNSIREYVYLMNDNGEILAHPYQSRYEEGFKPENNKELADLKDGSYKISFLGQRNIYALRTIGYTGWRLVSVYTASAEKENMAKWLIQVLFMISVFMIVILKFSEFISGMVSRPIGELEKSVGELAGGKLDTEVRVYGSIEVRSLAKSVNRLVCRIRFLMEEVRREQKLKRKSEMDSLQSQINPHFLYNTLDVITWMIEKGRNSDATEIVTALARLFRISISKGKNVITVENEIEHVRNYLLIQSRRYRDQFSYSIDIEEDVKNLSTVKLIVQPIVENAIYHAMEFMEDEGEIFIRAYRKGEDLYISVRDNGMGMTEEQQESLLKKPVESKRGNGIGIYNVNERIRLYFGIEYGIIINSEPDEGTEIILHMPAIEYGDWKE